MKEKSVVSLKSEGTKEKERLHALQELSKRGSFRDRAKREAEASQLARMNQLYSSFRSKHSAMQQSQRTNSNDNYQNFNQPSASANNSKATKVSDVIGSGSVA